MSAIGERAMIGPVLDSCFQSNSISWGIILSISHNFKGFKGIKGFNGFEAWGRFAAIAAI
jgi:hypothetical protein